MQVIDEDLGKSGAGSVERRGFQKLITDTRQCRSRSQPRRLSGSPATIATGTVVQEALLGVCRADPRMRRSLRSAGLPQPLLLGLSGIMSEAELHQIRMRLNMGERQKAARGELHLPLPAGSPPDRAAP